MKSNIIQTFKNDTAGKIRRGCLGEAFADMRSFSENALTWEITTAIDRLENNYTAMLGYVAAGIDDPGRGAIYDDIVNEALAIVDLLVRRAEMVENASLYYTTARSLATHAGETIASLAAAYRAELRRLADDFVSIADPRRTVRAENLMSDLFKRVWTTHPLSTADVAALDEFMATEAIPVRAKAMILGAVTLGSLEFYDPSRVLFLARECSRSDVPELRARALTGLCATLFRYRRRPSSQPVAAALAALREEPWWAKGVAFVAMELMRASTTEKISTRMRDEVLSSMMKIDPEIGRKLRSGEIDLASLMEGENPEWRQSMDDSGVTDSLRELSEIQADGGDVFMSSFAGMKQFPFFNDISHWFMMFDPSNSAVAEIDPIDGTMADMLAKMPILCDSDKYSVMLSINSVPSAQREALLGGMRMQSEQMAQAMSEVEKAAGPMNLRNAVNKYVQDLYRFFNLFRRKGEFFNIFRQTPEILGVKAISDGYDSEEGLAAMADFFFRHEMWPQAATALKLLDNLSSPEARRLQQLGYALERSDMPVEAIARYEEADYLDPTSRWTLRHLADALRREGRPREAVIYYKRLEQLDPEDAEVALRLAYALTEAGNVADAMPRLHKAAYMMPDSLKPLRGLGWAQFLSKDFDAAASTYGKILERGPIAEDYLNAGHVARARGDVRGAVELYRRYAAADTSDPERLERALLDDRQYLAAAGIDVSSLRLFIEAVKYLK